MGNAKKKTTKTKVANANQSETVESQLPGAPKPGKNGIAAIFYTDGGARPNPGPAGYGVWGIDSDLNEYNGWGFAGSNSTNNRAELLGYICALKTILAKKIRHATLFLDSKYVLENVQENMKKWKAAGWKKSTGDEVSNKDLWIEVDKLVGQTKVDQIDIRYRWVKGHSDDPGNDAADANATRARLAAEKGDVHEVMNIEKVTKKKTAKPKPVSFNKLIAGRRMVFTTNTDMVTKDGERIYFSANFDDGGGARGKNFGTEASDSLNAVVITNNPVPQFESVIEYQNDITPDDFVQPVVLMMDKLVKPINWNNITEQGKSHLNHTRLNVVTVEGEPLTIYVRPPRRAYEGVDRLMSLYDTLEQYRLNSLPASVKVFDVTEQLISKGKKDWRILNSITGSDKAVVVKLPIGKRTIELPLTFNIDLPTRNHINAVGKTADTMSVKLLAHSQTKTSFRYEVVIEADGDSAIYATSHANLKII